MEGRSWGSALVHLGELHQDAWGARSSPQLPAHLSCLAGSGGALWGPLSKPKADSTNELQHKLGHIQQLLAPQQGRAAPCPQQVMGGRGQGRAGRGSQPPACPRLCPAGFYTSSALFDGRGVEEQEAWAWVWVSRDPPGKLGGSWWDPWCPGYHTREFWPCPTRYLLFFLRAHCSPEPPDGQWTSQGGYIPKTTPQREGNNYGVSKLGAVWGSEMLGRRICLLEESLLDPTVCNSPISSITEGWQRFHPLWGLLGSGVLLWGWRDTGRAGCVLVRVSFRAEVATGLPAVRGCSASSQEAGKHRGKHQRLLGSELSWTHLRGSGSAAGKPLDAGEQNPAGRAGGESSPAGGRGA